MQVGFYIYLINPLQTNFYVKGQSLRKTKTDKLDAHIIATMLITDNFKPYIPVSYHISELKSLTRPRFRLVKENSKFKTSLVRLVDIVFPELPKLVSSVAQKKEINSPILSITGISFKTAGSILAEIGNFLRTGLPVLVH